MPRALNGVRVLVVEDDADCREVFRIILEVEGAIVATAETAWEGLKMAGQFRPDVLVSDLALPDEDGCWLIRSMKAAARAGARPPRAVIVTADTEAATRARCLRAGCDAFLTKPVDAMELSGVVARLARDRLSPPPHHCAV